MGWWPDRERDPFEKQVNALQASFACFVTNLLSTPVEQGVIMATAGPKPPLRDPDAYL
jgi:hypothetical protein